MSYTLELLKGSRDAMVRKREAFREISLKIDAMINRLSDDIAEIDRKTEELEVRQNEQGL